MERRQGSLVPIGKASGSLDGPVKMIHDTSPKARCHFTQADQVNQLVSANESDPDLGFMARLMTLCCLPRTNPGNRGSQAPLWKSASPDPGLALHRSGTHPKPRDSARSVACRIYAGTRHLQ